MVLCALLSPGTTWHIVCPGCLLKQHVEQQQHTILTSLLVSFSVALDTKTKQTNKSVFSQAFEANASSSGGIQTLIDIHISQDDKITTFYELQK